MKTLQYIDDSGYDNVVVYARWRYLSLDRLLSEYEKNFLEYSNEMLLLSRGQDYSLTRLENLEDTCDDILDELVSRNYDITNI